MKLYQTFPNSVWYTDDVMFSTLSNKQIYYGIEVKDKNGNSIGLFDRNEFSHYALVNQNDEMWIRIIESNAKPIKQTRIMERKSMNLKLRYKILSRDKFSCKLCGRTAKETKLEVDHIIPISKGGKSTEDNLRTLCFECNRGKSNI